jgi:hypothetical protein
MKSSKPHVRHPFVTALLSMTAQVVFPDLRRPPDDVDRQRQADPKREAAAVAKRERKNLQRALRR